MAVAGLVVGPLIGRFRRTERGSRATVSENPAGGLGARGIGPETWEETVNTARKTKRRANLTSC